MNGHIQQMIDAIASNDLVAAQALFQQAVADKVTDTLDAERAAVAASIYGAPEIEDEEEFEDEDELAEVDEDVEELDEISIDKMKDYYGKSKASADDLSIKYAEGDAPRGTIKKYMRRKQGQDRARRLAGKKVMET